MNFWFIYSKRFKWWSLFLAESIEIQRLRYISKYSVGANCWALLFVKIERQLKLPEKAREYSWSTTSTFLLYLKMLRDLDPFFQFTIFSTRLVANSIPIVVNLEGLICYSKYLSLIFKFIFFPSQFLFGNFFLNIVLKNIISKYFLKLNLKYRINLSKLHINRPVAMKILYFSKRGKKELFQSNHCFSIFCHWEAKKKKLYSDQKHMELNRFKRNILLENLNRLRWWWC